MPTPRSTDALAGLLFGTAVADALGLPYEGLSRRRAARLLGPPDRHRLVAQRGMISDDTEHACIVTRALLASGGDVARFETAVARSLVRWLWCVPPGIGLATLRATFLLSIGVPRYRAGVRSAGNGPAMRAPVIGLFARDKEHLHALVRASTRLTHMDDRAAAGAFAVALAVFEQRRQPNAIPAMLGESIVDDLARFEDGPMVEAVRDGVKAAQRGVGSIEFAASLGLDRGVSGFVLHTVPVALHAWMRFPDDYETGVRSVIECGGDTDTVGAIVGGLIGARVGVGRIPGAWIDGVRDWPRSTVWIMALARAAAGDGAVPREPFYGLCVGRNIVLAAIVLAHGFRRLLPPY